jgi:hypothetical protein
MDWYIIGTLESVIIVSSWKSATLIMAGKQKTATVPEG